MEQYLAHSEILSSLIKEISIIDFEAIAFPEKQKVLDEIKELNQKLNSINSSSTDNDGQERLKALGKKLSVFKINQRHLQVITIDYIIELAKSRSWNLCKNNQFIYIYNGAFWKQIEKDAFQSFLGQAAEKLGVDKFFAQHFNFKEQLFKQFMSSAFLPTPVPPEGEVLINLKNGTLVFSQEKVTLKAFDSRDFLTYQLAFGYDTEAKCPLFQKYLDKVLPDASLQEILLEYMGYVFIHTSTLKLEKVLLLYGSGANGKSVFYEISSSIFGADNVSNYSLQSLTNDTGYSRAKLANILVNYASEINGKLEASIFKQLASGEPVEARLPYGEPFNLKSYGKLIFNCNELPKEVEHTAAFFRRFLIIPFEVTIPEHEQDKELANNIISNELSGVMNLVILGLKRLLSQKAFTPSQAADKLKEQFKKQSDTVQLFLEDERYEKSVLHFETLKDIYNQYKFYCSENGYRQGSVRMLSERLKNLGFEIVRKSSGNVVHLQKKPAFLDDDFPF